MGDHPIRPPPDSFYGALVNSPNERVWLTERFWPGITDNDVRAFMAGLSNACDVLFAQGVDVRWLGGMFIPHDETIACRFEGTAQAVRAAHEIAAQRFDRLSATVEFG